MKSANKMTVTVEQLNQIWEEQNLSYSELGRRIIFPPTSVYRWFIGETIPNIQAVELMAKAMGYRIEIVKEGE